MMHLRNFVGSQGQRFFFSFSYDKNENECEDKANLQSKTHREIELKPDDIGTPGSNHTCVPGSRWTFLMEEAINTYFYCLNWIERDVCMVAVEASPQIQGPSPT
jgi:hypothetical protein